MAGFLTRVRDEQCSCAPRMRRRPRQIMYAECAACDVEFQYVDDPDWPPPSVCSACRLKYPRALVKALDDPFDYAAGLVTGEIIRFQEAAIQGSWVLLRGLASYGGGDHPVGGLKYPCPRGVWVHRDQLAWVADAPEGS